MSNCEFDLAPFARASAENDGWAADAFKDPYVAFNPDLLICNDMLFSELLFSAHAIKTKVRDTLNDVSENLEEHEDSIIQSELVTFVETCADTFALDRPCLVCRVLDTYRRRLGLSAMWMADYAFLCSKCLGAPPCSTATFIAAFEFVYIMDKHFLVEYGFTLVGSFAKKLLTLEDIQRHFFLHGCFRTDGGVPGRRHDEIISSRGRQGRSSRGNIKGPTFGDAKVLYSNYSYLAQSATRAMLMTLSDLNDPSINTSDTPNKFLPNGAPSAVAKENQRKSTSTNPHIGQTNSCPTALSVALAGWKDCARNVECNSFQNESCTSRAASDDDAYERELDLHSDDASKTYDTEPLPAAVHTADVGGLVKKDFTVGYNNLILLLLSGTGSLPTDTSELARMASKVRKETVDKFWKTCRHELAPNVTPSYSACYTEDSEPDLELGPLMATQLKHAMSKGGTSAECLLCNLLIIRTYWQAMRKFKRQVIVYSSNNIGLFHSIEPVLDAWGSVEENVDLGDDGCFLNLMKATGAEAIYKHLFCDPMCAARIAQTNPRTLFTHPTTVDDDLPLYKARLASQNHFEGRVCAGFWALAYAFKTYQVFPPRPTALSAFVKDAGALLQRHSISLISLAHSLGDYV
ncbi:UL32 DNA packaging protein [Meleagrid alphaherpesvirus 1]|uniref:Packaging protein UL32 n=1 Tax=Meleagrid herpesvirus 1 TaxID=37108 RepID=Q9DHA1_MEHV1|nr:DNA packaging protein UL32 [Meleagrid alphaherpesvirus 1]AKQ48601.1 DNA packaging protein UL32 [iBAC vector pMeHV1-C7]AKQ48673.1 DNA packaging protein UL32 [iBAC vector pMeHV1-C9]AKQ48745.1 DNA packaging protein UL32 [iBAC vector pMeHV1-C10]AKQ48817.1 DNA packaging protein UL32 [iBAC vector pMeHV1-C17]AKQ48889.1 DNA packaging protein UL32 [iBAC vector pMeHV1-C18]